MDNFDFIPNQRNGIISPAANQEDVLPAAPERMFIKLPLNSASVMTNANNDIPINGSATVTTSVIQENCVSQIGSVQ